MPAQLKLSDLHFRDLLREGDVVSWPQGPGEPLALSNALMAQGHELQSPGLFLGMSMSKTVLPEHARVFALRGLNGAGTNRRLTADGLLDVLPCHVSSVPALLRSRTLTIDVALVQVRRHPTLGGYTLGVIADYTQALVRQARVVIAQINDALPLTADDALVAEDDIDVFVEAPDNLIEMPDPLPNDLDGAVARQVATLIPDRAT